MKVHYLQHVPFEDPAIILSWAISNVHTLSATRFFSREALPPIDDFDLLIIMGGPMNVYDYDKYPWLREEKKFIEQAISSNKKVMGICLGAQLIADVLGAQVRKNREPEIGWFPVNLLDVAESKTLFKDIPETITAFHWHGDTFDIPQGAQRIAENEACENQTFIYGNNVIGFQFHLESTPQSIEKLIINCPDDLVKAKFVHSARRILEDSGEYAPICNNYVKNILDEFIK
ncbi:MAG TPA: type 1 glutamine amidotransferase [Spirochaetota bacterium]|nr:type 1 glutamine amidotransferase [Spirochaetota bacterium]HPI88182.1 type 1 glutamine amidotransferase [Spirochaetota bacterium]HPR47957.1 type 1 glutamine amidotransferase [Spirochaetota bacterium]